MTIGAILLAGALLISIGAAMGSYIALVIRELPADKHRRDRFSNLDQ